MSGAMMGSSADTTIIVVVIIVLILLRRTISMIRGAAVSPVRLFGYAALYGLIFVGTIAAGAAEIPWYFLALDAGVVVVATILATRYVRDHVVLEQRPPAGQWFYKLHPWIPITYLGLFLLRIGVAFWLLGPSAFDFGSPTPSLSGTQLGILEVVDVLFAGSTGLLFGRSVGVYLAYQRRLAQQPPGPAPPLATQV